jgi:hypothetical protein
MNHIFYAVSDDTGICSISDGELETAKAIFFDKKDAEKLLDMNKGEKLKITPVNIITAKIPYLKRITMPKHIHADLMATYAQIAQTNNEPWRYFQYRLNSNSEWFNCFKPIGFFFERDYRLKPKTIRIGEYDVPEPVREPLKQGAHYYMPQLIDHYEAEIYLYEEDKWDNVGIDYRRLNKGLIHLDRESAELHAQALISLTENK